MARKRYKKDSFSPRRPKIERPLLRAICFFCGVFKKPTVYHAADQQPQYQAERARCVGCGLVTQFSAKITNSSESKRKRKIMRSGGISDEDTLNRPFPFTPGVNNPNESNI